MTKHRQHYVWQHYLRAWCNSAGLVHCSRNKQEPITINPKNVMVERHFYKLQYLTQPDLDHLIWFIENHGSPNSIPHYRKFIELIALATKIHESIKNNISIPSDTKETFRKLSIETEEKLHSHIENHAVPILDQLRQKQNEFMKSDKLAAVFYSYFAQQYFRTKNTRELVKRYFSRQPRLQTSGNITNFYCYFKACIVGHTFASESNSLEIVFLENKNSGFVTGDQPIINLLANRFGGDVTDYAFYYPLSPHLACLLTHKSRNLSSKLIPPKIMNKLNGLMSCHSHQFLIGDSANAIQLAIKNQPTPNQTVRDIFESLTTNS